MALPTQRSYKLTSREYAEQFNVSKSTVDRWRQMGAPLDQPEKMAAWISVNNSRQKPAGMTFEVVEDEESQEQGLVRVGGFKAEIEAEIEFEVGEKFGARVEICALEKECAKLRKIYDKNRAHPVLGPKYFKDYTKALDVLRTLSKDTPKSEESDSKSILIEVVKASLFRNLSEIKNHLEIIPQKVRKGCEHLDDEIMVEVEEIIKREIAYTVRAMQEAEWLTIE